MHPNRYLSIAALSVGLLAVAGCASTSQASPSSGEGQIQIVASTNVYGQIAEEIGGADVVVTSLITSAAQDPHSFEPSAQDQLAVNRAELIIENGGGYDSFIEALVDSSDTAAHVITVAEFSHDWPGEESEHADGEEHAESEEHAEGEEHEGHDHVEGFNEHVWYDPDTIEHFAEDLAAELGELRPDDADVFNNKLDAFLEGLSEVTQGLDAIKADHAGEAVFATEPVPLYLVEAAGLVNVSPAEFTEAVEEGQDVPPIVMLDSLTLLRDGNVRSVLVNTQTGGAETVQIESEADTLGIPLVPFAETLPDGATYLSWMIDNVAALAEPLEP